MYTRAIILNLISYIPPITLSKNLSPALTEIAIKLFPQQGHVYVYRHFAITNCKYNI